MSSSSPTPSPSSVTPTTSPQLHSTHFRSSRQVPSDLDEENVHNLSQVANAGNPSFSLSPPGLSQSSVMSAATMSSSLRGGSSSSSSSSSTSSAAAAAAGGGNGINIGGLGNGKAGLSMVSNASPSTSNLSSSRSPPYYNGLGGMRQTSAGSRGPPLTIGDNKDRAGHRKRSSSLVTVEKIETSHEELLDQSAGFNANADWVNYKGAWVIHVVLILLGKILVDVIPGMEQDTSWTIVNLGYIAISYLMFHYVTGTPFESNAGVYDELTLWEQIDEGAQYTPAKKWLTSMPIGLFLVSTHYTRYNPWLFSLNFFALLFVLFPKLPILHRLRFKVMPFSTPHTSQPPTPTHSRPNSAAGFR